MHMHTLVPVEKKEPFKDTVVITPSNTHAFIINMERNPDRLHRFKMQFNRSDLQKYDLTRIDAIDGKTIDITQHVSSEAYRDILTSEKNGYRMRHYELTRGAVGCYLSHIKAYEEALKCGKPYALIFEDDVRFLTNDIQKELNEQLLQVPQDWDMLLLGYVCFVCGKFDAHYEANRFILLHAYVVKAQSLPKIIGLLKGNPIKQQLDAEFSDLAEHGDLKIYCLRKKLAMQFNMGTNIQMPIMETQEVNPYESFDEKIVLL